MYNSITQVIQDLASQPDFPTGELGYTVGGVFRVVDPDDPRKFFVRFPNGNFVSAFHYNRVQQKPNAPVLVRHDKLGRPEIVGIDPVRGDTFFSTGNGGSDVGIHDHVRGSGREFIIDTWLLKQLRATIIEGTFTVNVVEGLYLYDNEIIYFAGDTIDLSAYVPTNSDEQRWVIVGIDPLTNDLVSEAGSVELPFEEIGKDFIPLIPFLSLGYIPLAAVYLRYGDIYLQNFQIEDLRHLTGHAVWNLGDLQDVDTGYALSGYVLTFDGYQWVGTPPTGGGGSIETSDGTTTVNPTTKLSFDPTDFSVTDLGAGEAEVSFIGSASGSIEVSDGTTTVNPATKLTVDPTDFQVNDLGSGEAELEFIGSVAGSITVTDGVTSVNPATTLEFTSGATVTNAGSGVAQVAISGGGGASDFTDLTDTPSSYSGSAGNLVRVNNTPDGLEFIPNRRTQGFTVEGDLTTGANPFRLYNQSGVTRTINKVHISVSNTPTGAAIIVDIHKNGTTIFTTQANRPQIAISAYEGQSTTINVPSWANGEYLTMEIDQVGSGGTGANLTVLVVYDE